MSYLMLEHVIIHWSQYHCLRSWWWTDDEVHISPDVSWKYVYHLCCYDNPSLFGTTFLGESISHELGFFFKFIS